MKFDGRALMKFAGVCGVASPLVVLVCIFAAASLSPWYSWTYNYISDIGGHPGDRPVWSVHGAASILLNIGLIAAGLMGVAFAFVLRGIKALGTPCGRLGSSLFLLDMVALMSVGIFPESTGGPHGVAAVSLFVLIPLSLIFMGIGLRETSDEKRFAVLVLLLGLASFLSFALFALPRPYGQNGVVELIPSICTGTFSISFGFRLMANRLK
jgi:hypothetical membrane protein